MRYRYSRLKSNEEKQNIRSAAIYIALTIGALLLILFFGIPLMGRVAGFFHDLRTSGEPVDIKDTTPPAPPIIDILPDVTNKTVISISGRTEAGAIVTLKLNDKEEEVVANSEGGFHLDWEINQGENKFSAKSKDTAGNVSADSKTYAVTFDNKPPELTVTSPQDGKQFNGSRERQTSIQGKTEDRATLTINDRIVAVDEEGVFSFFTSLTPGENKFNIIAKDRAGNETKKEITLIFNQ